MSFLLQNPGDTVKYQVDWSGWLGTGDTIISDVWSILPIGPAIVEEEVSGVISTVELSNVSFGKTYNLTCTATLSTGEDVSKTYVIRGGVK